MCACKGSGLGTGHDGEQFLKPGVTARICF